MKHPYSLLLFALLLFGCRGNQTDALVDDPNLPTKVAPAPDIPLEEQLQAKIEAELKSGVRNDTIILDHTFGMSRKQVVAYKNKLVRKKKVYGVYKTKNTRVFVYDLKLAEEGNVRVYFDTFYHEGELYRIECLPKIPKKSTPKKVMDQMIVLFNKKYGKPDFIIPIEGKETCSKHFWIMGNLKIEIACDEKETMLSYTDMVREMKTLGDI